ncbi:VOC family protein [Halomonas sp. PGE1]|uniref:VOC family protein n=1 Tax=Halomonas sp. PGE1 TaxID=2730360 RepID=UPI001472FE5C|nr:VOC family protein [Halomonas sp. PGE1]QJQ98367.1 VOC family protein [Halomonas sp. PGE1]
MGTDAPSVNDGISVGGQAISRNDAPGWPLTLDSHLDHQFSFTPSMSLYVECESSNEIEEAFRALADGGSELMPLDNYGFSQKFGWLKDRYGVSWQLNLSD